MTFCKESVKVLLNLSACPLLWGWYALVTRDPVPTMSFSVWMALFTNSLPWFVIMTAKATSQYTGCQIWHSELDSSHTGMALLSPACRRWSEGAFSLGRELTLGVCLAACLTGHTLGQHLSLCVCFVMPICVFMVFRAGMYKITVFHTCTELWHFDILIIIMWCYMACSSFSGVLVQICWWQEEGQFVIVWYVFPDCHALSWHASLFGFFSIAL